MSNTETLETIEKTLDTIEDTLDVVESNIEQLDVVDAVEKVYRTNPYLLIGVGLVALSTGAFIGYKVAEKRLTTKYDQLVAEEIAEAKQFYSRANKRDEFETPEAAAKALIPEEDLVELAKSSGLDEEAEKQLVDAAEAIKTYRGLDGTIMTEEVQGEKEVITSNIFVDGKPLDIEEFDYEAEQENRRNGVPFIITQDEFLENEPEHEQITITYYMGDDVLADEEDSVIDNPNNVIGQHENLRFGHGSKDQNIVYIRNEGSGTDFEVLRSTGKYAKEVLGFDEDAEELKHSARRGSRRSWGDDE